MKNPEDFTKDTGIPLDTDIEENIPVKKITVDEIDEKRGTARFSVKTVMEKQTVRYMNVPKVRIRCPDGEHVFRILNKPKYLFACTKCPFVRKVYPSTYKYDQSTGKLIHRVTGRAV